MFYFICMFDCNAFLQRMGWNQNDLARRLEIGTSTVGMWCIGKSTPKNKSLEKLLLLGATPTELFGPKIDEILRNYYIQSIGGLLASSGTTAADREFDERVRRAVIKLLSSLGKNI